MSWETYKHLPSFRFSVAQSSGTMVSQESSAILPLAKEGNPKAIAALINRQFKSKGIRAKATVKGSRLEILLEANMVPEQQPIARSIGRGLTNLNPHGISSVRLFARKTGEDFFDWETTFSIPFDPKTNHLGSLEEYQASEKPLKKLDKKPYGILGKNGQIKLTEKRVIISRKGFWGFVSQGISGSKEIPIAHITAVQFKEAGEITTGFLQFSILGGIESTGGVFHAANDENTVLFESQQQKEFEEVKRYVDSVIDGESIDFLSLNLPDFDTVEKERIEAQNRLKSKYDEQMSFSSNLDSNFWLTAGGGSISFLAVTAMFTSASISIGGFLMFLLGTLMVPRIWKVTEKQLGFSVSKKNRIITAVLITVILFISL